MQEPSRRRFLAASAVAGLSGLGLAGYAFGPAAAAVEFSRVDVPVRGLPDALDGLRVAHVTDVHLPANRRAVERALRFLSAERPEVVVFTGDIVEVAEALDDLRAFARLARGTVASFAVRGNWEVSAGIGSNTLRSAWESAGVTYLENGAAIVELGQARLGIVGLDDPVLGRPNPTSALARLDGGDAILWAMHGPGFADGLPADTPADLLLAGHTHGGQVRIPLVPAFKPTGSGRFLAGWYDTAAAPLYVSRGVGTTDIRARFRCPPELPVLTLRKAGVV